MTKRSLEELKASFKTQDSPRESLPNNYYPFWLMENDQRAVIRFLPDKDDNNPRGFLVEKVFHNLMINGQKKNVPCLGMYGEECPVCKVSQDYYKHKDEVNGKKYWRKKQYIAQALIIEDPLPVDSNTGENHEGKVRYLALGWQLYNIIKEAFASDDLENVPYDFEEGSEFVIKKTEQGKYSTYVVGSKFLSKERALSEEELAVVEEGMIELATLLPRNPGEEKVRALLNADLNGEAVEDDGGSDNDGDEEVTPKAAKVAKPAKESAPAKKVAAKKPAVKVDEDEDESGDGEVLTDVDKMLEAIRNRKNASK